MRLQTPEKIRTLQRKLYLKAKAEPDFRFYLLYDKVYREDILFHAYRLARSNKGAPGVDGQSFEEIEAMGLEGWLSGIRDDLRAKTYRPEPVRRAMVPKPGGGERPLGIPTIRDRVVQGAVKLVIEPIFEADLEPSAYGYRPKRSAGDAVQAVHKLLCRGYTDVVDADLSKYFDTIPHAELMQSVARRIVDRNVLRLIKLWLKTPVEETDGDGKRRMTGGRGSTRGTPQGGIVSPLLAALYMNRFLKYWRITGQGTRFRAEVVNYADDLVILSRGHAREALAWTRQVMTRLGLTLNEAKTSVRDGRKESFDFLGYSFGPQRFRKDGHWYLGASPSRKSVARLKLKVRGLLRPGDQAPWPEVRDQLNSVLRGWSHYFGYGTRLPAYRAVDNYVYERVRHFVGDPKSFLSKSSFSPHYAGNCALRHDMDEILEGLRKTNNGRRDCLFVVMEEYRKIEPVPMSKGECLAIDQGAIRVERRVTRQFSLCAPRADLAFGALRVERKLNDEALDEKTKKLTGNVLMLEELAGLSPLTELITALRLEDTRDKSHLCLWYLRLWEASCKAGTVVGAPQFGNPDGIKVGQDDRRRQLEHRNDVAHGRVDEIDFAVFDRFQRDVLDLLRKNVLGRSEDTRDGC